MARTQPRGGQILDGSVSRDDLNVADAGQAVVRKLVEGTGVSLSSTGADAGTGDVTVSTPAAGTAVAAGHVTNVAQTFGGRKTYDSQYLSAEFDAGDSASTTEIDWDDGNTQRVALVGAVTTLTLTNGVAGARYLLRIDVDATGGYSITWPAALVWPKGFTPPTPLADEVWLVALYFDGTNYRANLAVYEE